MDNIAPSLASRIRTEQTRLMFSNASLSSLVSLINAGLAFFVLWDHMPQYFMLGWLGVMIIVVCLRLLVFKLYWQQRNTPQNSRRWLGWYGAAALASAAAWGALAYVAGLQETPWVQAFAAFILASVTADGLIALSATLSVAIPYMVIAVLPLSISLLQQDAEMQLLGIVTLLYLILLMRAASRMHQLQTHSIEARLESDSLFEFLKYSKEETEALKRSLTEKK